MQNLFKDLAVEQEKESHARILILAKLKNNDIKGAHRIAKPYLQKIAERKNNNEHIPSSWVRISQILCAKDIEIHGITKSNNKGDYPEDISWIEYAKKIISCRLKGLSQALLPSSVAIALMCHVLTAPYAKAQVPKTLGKDPDSIVLKVEEITEFGKLRVETTSALNNDKELTKPELRWFLEDKGPEVPPKENIPKFIHSATSETDKSLKELTWKLDKWIWNPTAQEVNLEISVENPSSESIEIRHFSTSEMDYKGSKESTCESVSNKYDQSRSPKEIKPKAKITYHLNAKESSSPTVILKTECGQTHSMLLSIPKSEKLIESKKEKTRIVYGALNDGYADLAASIKCPDTIKLHSIYVEGKTGIREVSKDQKIIIHPGNKLTVKVISEGTTSSPSEIEVVTNSREGHRLYTLSSSNAISIKEKFLKSYKTLTALIYGKENGALSWEGIKTKYDKERSALIKHSEFDKTIPGDKIISTLYKQSIKDEIKGKELTEAENKIIGEILKTKVRNSEPKKASKAQYSLPTDPAIE